MLDLQALMDIDSDLCVLVMKLKQEDPTLGMALHHVLDKFRKQMQGLNEAWVIDFDYGDNKTIGGALCSTIDMANALQIGYEQVEGRAHKTCITSKRQLKIQGIRIVEMEGAKE